MPCWLLLPHRQRYVHNLHSMACMRHTHMHIHTLRLGPLAMHRTRSLSVKCWTLLMLRSSLSSSMCAIAVCRLR